MNKLRALVALYRHLADLVGRSWGHCVGESWASWSYPVQMGVLYTFLWGFGLVTRPLFGQHLLKGSFSFLSLDGQIEVGWMLIALTALALRWPRRFALASTYLIAALKVADGIILFNPYGIIFWLLVVNGMREKIDAAHQPLHLIATEGVQRGISCSLLGLTIFAWLHPSSGALALIVAISLIQAINSFAPDTVRRLARTASLHRS